MRLSLPPPALLLAAAALLGLSSSCTDDVDTGAEPSGAAGPGGAASASSSSASSSASTGGSGGGPIVCGRPTSDVPAGECDLLQQDCPPGFGCEPDQVDGAWTTVCVQSNGLKAAGSSCANHAECQAGLACVLETCAPPCCPENHEPCGGGLCSAALEFGPHEVQYCAYLELCRIFTPDACATPGENCYILNNEGYAVCAAPSSTMKLEGEPCEFLNECSQMQTCFPPGSPAAVCRWHCDLAAPAGTAPGLGGCPAGQTCKDFNVGYPGVGVCAP